MAQAPAPTTSIPLTLPPEVEEGGERVTIGARQGWKLPTGVIVFDDGEKVMPTSGLSDQQKRDEALRMALGEVRPPQQPGVPDEAVRELRLGAAQLADSGAINDKRKAAARELARLRPGKDQAAIEALQEALPPTAEALGAGLRQRARALVDLEVPRIEELKELATRPGVLLSRDGIAVQGNALAILHNHLVEAVSCAERGDITRTAAALAELRRWSITGGV